MKKQSEIKLPATDLPTLSEASAAMGAARLRLEDMALRYDRESMIDRLWIGVNCLVAQERHTLNASAKGKLGGRGNKSLSRRDMVSEISPDQPHPQGFMGWVAASVPWLNRATAYKYMDAARGAGMTAWTTEDQVRAWTVEILAKDKALTIKSLVDAGRKLIGPVQGTAGPEPDFIQMTWESIAGFGAQTESIIARRDRMTPKQYDLACAQAYRALRELTGSPWGPTDEDDQKYIQIIEEARKGGL